MSYNTRIKLKSDTESNWLSQDPVLLDGEVAIVKCDGGITRKKIGDGYKKFSELSYDESKSLGLTSTAVGQIPKVKAVDSNGVPTEWEATVLSGDMVYVLDVVDGEGDAVTINNNFDDVVAAINQGKIIVSDGLHLLAYCYSPESGGTITEIIFTALVGNGYITSLTWNRGNSVATATTQLFPVLGSEALSAPGAVYFDNSGGFTIKNTGMGAYVIKVQNDVLVNDYTELENAIKDHRVIISGEDTGSSVCFMAFCNENSISLFFLVESRIIVQNQISKETKKITQTMYVIPSINGEKESSPHSGFIYYDLFTKDFSIKDTTPPIATTSTAGIIKVGNGLSISADGTLSVTAATYYTGTTDPVNTLGADGDLYLKTEG